jgi:hypothetical protein
MSVRDPEIVHAKIRTDIESIKKRFENYPLSEADRTIIAFQLDIVGRANDRLLKKVAKVDA